MPSATGGGRRAVAEAPRALSVRLSQQRGIPLDATLDCAPGEILALVGPSGSGKSTILRAIAGLMQPQEGRVAVGGEVWFDATGGVHRPPRERSVGFVFQSYALFPHMSALDNVACAMGDVPRGDRPARAADLLERVNLKGLEGRRPAELSGGQQQRVAVARALARDPRVLLMDEPFSAVDRSTRQILYRELAVLRRDLAIPVVLVTHDLEEAAALSDRMCILHRGRTLQADAPQAVLSRPANSLVARLVNLRNVFTGKVIAHDAERGLTLIESLGRTLEARLAPAFAPGSAVAWAVPSSHVVLHRRDRPSRGERENPVRGRIEEFLPLGENATVTIALEATQDRLHFTLPVHVASRNGLGAGTDIGVSLLAEGIHLMPD